MGYEPAAQVQARYQVRLSRASEDLVRAERLRAEIFRGDAKARDLDAIDPHCLHGLIEQVSDGALVGCFRMLPLKNGAQIDMSYSAQYYDLSKFYEYSDPLLELGRFCVAAHLNDPDILRVALGAVTRFVDDNAIACLFGCSSFAGTDPAPYWPGFAHLSAHHGAPERLAPGRNAQDIIDLAQGGPACPKEAVATLPGLLRSYLMMGGWVSDHAVVDRDLGTLHVFTGVEIAAIPPARKRVLRALAA